MQAERGRAERGVYKVVDRGEMKKLKPESVLLSVKWVITNEGSPERPKPKGRLVDRKFVSGALHLRSRATRKNAPW